MLVLFETAAGHALFKYFGDKKFEKCEDLFEDFASAEKAMKTVKLKSFLKFENTLDALESMSELVEGKLSKNLKKFLKKEISEEEKKQSRLIISDPKLASAITKKIGIEVLSDKNTNELFRGIRCQLENLLTGISEHDLSSMSLGLSHSLSRHKLKFSTEKVDTMIIQAVGLLDDLDKELNTYSMRVKEWYGWHFPEMAKIIQDNMNFAKIIKQCGMKQNIPNSDLSDIISEELEDELKSSVKISMGTEISEDDIINIQILCDEIISLYNYRQQLFEYLKNRMVALAPNLTALVGEIIGARLIAHSGSLLNLAKHPASTVQILGAEKALFRALKTKHDTPKYGLLYHASLIGQANNKLKGKMARILAAKSSLAVRCDALSENSTSNEIGLNSRIKLENRLKELEAQSVQKVNKASRASLPQKKFDFKRPNNSGGYGGQQPPNKRQRF